MSYQGHAVNFSQVSDQQFNSLIMEVGRTNQQVRTNSQNLVQMGKDMTVMGKNDIYFGDSITRLDGVVHDLTNVWQKTMSHVSTNTNAISTNSTNLVDLGNSLKEHSQSNHGGNGFNPFSFLGGLSTTMLAVTGLGAYLLLRKK